MRVPTVLRRVRSLFRERVRRQSVGARRAYIEFRDLDETELSRFSEAVQARAAQLRFIEWVQVNAYTRRVIFAYAEHAYGADELVAVIEAAERASRVQRAQFDEVYRHPGEDELGLQRQVELLADAIGFVLGLGLSISPLPAVPMSGNLVALLSLVRGSPRLRQGLEERLGTARAEFVMNIANSLLQAGAQRPLSSIVDVAHKGALLRESKAARDAWAVREPELFADGPAPPAIGPSVRVSRPCPLPNGPIEEYADRAWAVSLSGFALSFLTTRSIQRATAALFGGLPHPARVGRDVFAAELGQSLAQRHVIVQRPEVLRHLDRIDCLVLQGDLVSKDQFVLSGVFVEEAEEVDAARTRARRMFDVERPLAEQVDGLWRLRPWASTDATADIRLQEHARERLKQGALLLSLERAGRVVAVVEVDIIPRTGVEELIAAAHHAQMRVVVAAADETALDRFAADDVISAAEGLRAGIRRLQRDGHAVAMVATGDSEGLLLADLGIGLWSRGMPVPWGAPLICRGDLADVAFVIRSCRTARRVSKQAVNLALGAATFGALVSAGGLLPLTTRRVLFVVNVASLTSMLNGYRAATKLHRHVLPEPRDPTPWHALDAEGVLARLKSTRNGLVRTEVARRAKDRRLVTTEWEQLIEAVSDELFNPLSPLLAAGAGLSAVVGSTADAAMVAGVVVVNALVGGVQRFRTERKIRDLARAEVRFARVRRGGIELEIDANELVVGDIVIVTAGDVIPADCRVLEAVSLEVDASSLTGESMPVQKRAQSSLEVQLADRDSMLFEGTAVASGRAEAVVVAVGDATEARRGAGPARRNRGRGGVEQRLRGLMDLTGPVALAAGIGVVGGGLLRGRKLEELVGSGVSLAVASVPEGLPLLATVAQLAAAQRLSVRGALVRNGRSIEALGRVDVICFDKTGTVTEGRMVLFLVSDGRRSERAHELGRGRRHVLATALRASPSPGGLASADPTDDALYRSGDVATISPHFGRPGWRRQSELSFESGRGYHVTRGTWKDAKGQRFDVLSIKGAPEVVLPMCSEARRDDGSGESFHELTLAGRAECDTHVREFAVSGLRVLAVAERIVATGGVELTPDVLTGFTLQGFLAFSDPVRKSSKQAIRGLVQAGVRTVMITGDHPTTAQAVAVELELASAESIITGAQLTDMDDEQLDLRLKGVGVFARVTPAQKVRIVRALQRAGSVVGMVGDGANDAPAIRLADVGVALGEQSTEAARSAADIVLQDGRIETLVEAVSEGRAMWASVRDAVSILLGGNLGEIGFTTAVGLLSGRPPLSARQLLLVNLLTDIAPAMAIALRPPSSATLANLANEGPEKSLGQALNKDIMARAGLTTVGAAAAWLVARSTFGSRERAGTVALASLVGTQLGQTLRSGRDSPAVIATGLGSAAILAAIIQTPGLSQFFGCRPLGPVGWTTAVLTSLAASNLPSISRKLREAIGEDTEQVPPERAEQVVLRPRPLLGT